MNPIALWAGRPMVTETFCFARFSFALWAGRPLVTDSLCLVVTRGVFLCLKGSGEINGLTAEIIFVRAAVMRTRWCFHLLRLVGCFGGCCRGGRSLVRRCRSFRLDCWMCRFRCSSDAHVTSARKVLCVITCGTNIHFAFWAGRPRVTETFMMLGVTGARRAVWVITGGTNIHFAFWAGRPLVTETFMLFGVSRFSQSRLVLGMASWATSPSVDLC